MWPVLLGRAGTPDVWLSEKRQRKEGCDLIVLQVQTVTVEALTSAIEPCFSLGLDGRSAGPGPLLWTCWLGRGTCSSCSCCWAALCYSPFTLSSWFTIWKALLRLTLKSFCPFRELGWLVYMILNCTARWPQGLLYLVSQEEAHPCCTHLQSFYVIGFGDRVSCYLVYWEKTKPRHSSLTDHGRAQVVGGRSPVFQGVCLPFPSGSWGAAFGHLSIRFPTHRGLIGWTLSIK